MKAWDEAFKGNLVHLRISFGFLQTIDDFLIDVNPTPLAFSGYGCSLAEHALIRHYTTDYYSNLNLALEGVEGFILTSEFIEFKNSLNVALSKLPSYIGVVYRGLGKKESEISRDWVKDQVVEYKKFLSTSISKDEADGFMKRNKGDVMITIAPAESGKHVQVVSKKPDENEVLYKTNKKFIVKDIVDHIGPPPIREILLEEIND
jgi:hypothetical protein